MEVNKYQTPLTDELLNSLSEECKNTLLEYINTIPFIQRLISPDRPYAKDLSKDKDGKIIVDICNPHILQDMDYFRPAAIHYQQYGCFTKLRPNGNPNSEFGRWLKEEIRRCWDGYVRPSDGEWIPGDMYFYLNYMPIIQTKRVGKKGGFRIVDFPKVWEGVYLRAHYQDQARKGGIYNNFEGGQHAGEIASRGKSKSYYAAAKVAKLFLLGESLESSSKVKSLVTAYSKEFLSKDGILNKFESAINFCAMNTQFPRSRLKSSLGDMHWILGYKDKDKDIDRGTLNEVIGVSSKDDPDKSRGKRVNLMVYEEFGMFPKFLDTWSVNLPNVQEDSTAFGQAVFFGTGGSEGSDFAGALEMIYHPKGYNVYALPNVYDKNSQGKTESIFFFPAYMNNSGFYNHDGVSDVIGALISIIQDRLTLKYNSSDSMVLTRKIAEIPITIQEAIMKRDSTIYPVSDLTDRINQLEMDPHYLDNLWIGKLSIEAGEVTYKPDSDLKYITEFPHKDNKLEGAICIKELPKTDSTGKVPFGRYIAGCLVPGEKVLTDKGLKNVEEVTFDDSLVNIEGEYVRINTLLTYDKVDEEVYTLKVANTFRTTTFTREHPIYVSDKITKYSTKKDRQRQYTFDFNFKTVDKVKLGQWVRVPNLYRKEYLDYNLPFKKEYLESEDFWWFIGLWLGDGWTDRNKIFIAFNEKEQKHIDRFKRIITDLFGRSPLFRKRKHCIEGSFCYTELRILINSVFGQYAYGKRIPESVKYLPYSLKREFILGYLDSDGCITNKLETEFVSINLELLEGIQDMLFSLKCVSSLRKLRNATSNQKETYSLRMSRWETYKFRNCFPKLDDEKLIKVTPVECRCRPTFYECEVDDQYIYFKVTDINKSVYTGKVYNFDCGTHTFMCHHIPTHNCDPYDDDVSNTMSLGALYILDLFTDELVFEYVGRPQFAEEFYENCRRALLFYNAECNYENNKKGLFTYFSKHNCLYLLSPTLQFLRDKEMIKGELYGNKSRGVNATEHIKKYARRCIRDWLLKPVSLIRTTTLEDGSVAEQELTTRGLFTIPFKALLKELSMWNSDGNYDRHDALGMLMLLREDKLRLIGEDKPSDVIRQDPDYKGNDDFFNQNYFHPTDKIYHW